MIEQYSDIYREIDFWQEHVSMFEDAELVNEIAYLCYDVDEIDEVLVNYYGEFRDKLSKKERLTLEWFFVIVNLEHFIEDL